MKKIIQRIFFISVSLAVFIIFPIGIIHSFQYGDYLQQKLNSVLKLKVYESYTGGKTAAAVFDPLHDDYGSGTAVYPANSFYSEGNLDLVLYTVHEPVYHAPCMGVPEYWQMDLEFRTGFKDEEKPVLNRTIFIYIDTDNAAGGSLNTLFEQGENIRFNPEHPWDYAIAAFGNEGWVYNSKGEEIDKLEVVYSTTGKKVFIRVPLTKKVMQKIYTVKESFHYVLTGAYSQLDQSHLLPISKRKSRTSGGGSISTLMPKVYDVLYDGDQSGMLSSWNEDTFEFAQINPVSVDMKLENKAEVSVSKTKIEEIQKELNGLQEQYPAYLADKKAVLENETPSTKTKLELALIALNMGDRELSEKMITELLSADADNPSYIAYMGALESRKGANASVLAAVEAVNKGYALLDKAVQLTEGILEKVKNGTAEEDEIGQRYNALLNRGGTSQSVPNDVFFKAAQGSQDYLEAAEIAIIDNNLLMAARCYYDASICYSLDNKKSDAVIWKRESARIIQKMQDVDSLNLEDKINYVSLQLELYKEGYLK